VVDKHWRGARADESLTLLSKREMRLDVEQGSHDELARYLHFRAMPRL